MGDKVKKERLLTEKVRERILKIAKLSGIVQVSVFGSFVKEETSEIGDIESLNPSHFEIMGWRE